LHCNVSTASAKDFHARQHIRPVPTRHKPHSPARSARQGGFDASFIVSNVLLLDGAWIAFGAAWLVLLVSNRAAHFSFGYLFKRSFIALPFALAAITVIFVYPGNPVASWTWGSRTITISDAGVIRFFSIVIRSWLSVQAAILLTATTQFPDLMHALRHLKVPSILISIISFMYRYLFVLVDEAMRLLRAREARSARLVNDGKHGGTVFWRRRWRAAWWASCLCAALSAATRCTTLCWLVAIAASC
jgi:energy-coupling factor transporter transmembrane protein EcfT